MRNLFGALVKLVLLGILFGFVAIGAALYYLQQPAQLAADTNVIIRKGTGSRAIAHELAKAGIITHPDVFYLTQVATGNARRFKAGEYQFIANITPGQVAAKLVSGEVVVHKVTVVEGWNVREVKDVLMKDTVLEGEITREMKEGSLLPETYHFTYGDTRDAIVARMQSAMTKALDDAWATRIDGLPLASKEEALVLASIVEKETGIAEERPRVAAVFINRLKRGMLLQTDPTVIYGVEQLNDKPMDRALNYADLQTPSNYNTYIIPGLPPTPIANPSIESIEATLHPEVTEDLYFVAIGDGSGGHRFARTIDEHNKNVVAYRAALKAAR